MDDFVAILKTEYSAAFDEHRKKAMINSFYKYGPAKKNYGEYKCMDAIRTWRFVSRNTRRLVTQNTL